MVEENIVDRLMYTYTLSLADLEMMRMGQTIGIDTQHGKLFLKARPEQTQTSERWVDFSRLAVAITTHNRPAHLNRVVQQWSQTLPNYAFMIILVNHPSGADGFVPPERSLTIFTGRPPEHAGAMAKTWNLAMQWAFRDPNIDWLLCSMDDVDVLPGWPECLGKYEADLYLAPAGDLSFLFNRTAFHRIGWFDERYPVIGFQEWDWEARAIRALGLNRVSLHDHHGWVHNPVGLHEYWHHIGEGGEPTTRKESTLPVAERWLVEKWGKSVHDFIRMMASGRISDPVFSEVDWYPWFDR